MSDSDDWLEGELDLLRFLIKHPAATFYVRVTGHSMVCAGIYPGDILIVDRAVKAVSGDVIIASVNGELTVRRLKIDENGLILISENPNYKPIPITEGMAFEVWGKALHCIHSP